MTAAIELQNGQLSFARCEDEHLAWWEFGNMKAQTFAKTDDWSVIAQKSNTNFQVTLEPLVVNVDGATISPRQPLYMPVRRWQGGALDGTVETVGRGFTEAYSLVDIDHMADFAQMVTSVMPAAYIATVGVINNGNRAFISVRLGEVNVNVNGHKDVTNLYLSILNSWDGTSGFAVRNGSLRTECANTYAIALSEVHALTKGKNNFINGKAINLKHVGKMEDKLEKAKLAVMEEYGWAAAYQQYAQRLADQPMGKVAFDRMVREFVNLDKGTGQQKAAEARKLDVLHTQFDIETELRGGATAWGALNACTYLTSHCSIAKGTVLSAERQLETATFGDDTPNGKDGKDFLSEITAYLESMVVGVS